MPWRTTASGLSPAPRRHKLHIPHFRPKGENSLIPLLLLSPANPLRWALPGSPFSLRSSPNPSGKPRWDRSLALPRRRAHSPTQAVKRGDPPFAKGNRPAAEIPGSTRSTRTRSPNGTSPSTAESGTPPSHSRRTPLPGAPWQKLSAHR